MFTKLEQLLCCNTVGETYDDNNVKIFEGEVPISSGYLLQAIKQ